MRPISLLLPPRPLLCVLLLLVGSLGCSGGDLRQSEPASTVVLLAAASTVDVCQDALELLRQRESVDVVLSAGGSHALAAQVLAGAPAQVLLSASPRWQRELEERGRVQEAASLLENRLVVAVRKDLPRIPRGPSDLLALGTRIGLATGESPAGSYARQALEHHGLYESLESTSRLVFGKDVRSTLRYVESGAVDVAVVYATDAMASNAVEVAFTFEASSHDAIRYPLLLLREGASGTASDAARRVFEFFQRIEVAELFERAGFLAP